MDWYNLAQLMTPCANSETTGQPGLAHLGTTAWVLPEAMGTSQEVAKVHVQHFTFQYANKLNKDGECGQH